MKGFIDESREGYGVEPICTAVQVAPSTDYRHARCTVARQMGLTGVVRGQAVKTTISDKAAACPDDLVNRQWQAERPNALWVSDCTSVSTWQGVVYVAFVINVFARCIVGGNVSSSMRTERVLEALEHAVAARRPARQSALIHHSDRGSPYVSIRYTERLGEAGIAPPSVGRVGDSYDKALAETIHGLYNAVVIHRQSWKRRKAVEVATLTGLDCFNHRRLLEPISHVPPAAAEAAYYRQLDESALMV